MISSLAVMLVLAAPSQGSVLIERYKAWDEAYLHQRVLDLAKILHPKFTLVTETGQVHTRKAYISRLWKSTMPSVYETTVLHVERQGEILLALSQERMQKPGGELDTHKYEDSWKQENGTWLMLKSRTVEDK